MQASSPGAANLAAEPPRPFPVGDGVAGDVALPLKARTSNSLAVWSLPAAWQCNVRCITMKFDVMHVATHRSRPGNAAQEQPSRALLVDHGRVKAPNTSAQDLLPVNSRCESSGCTSRLVTLSLRCSCAQEQGKGKCKGRFTCFSWTRAELYTLTPEQTPKGGKKNSLFPETLK